jgi:hypothetical protein
MDKLGDQGDDMAQTIIAARQRNAVSQGIAFGFCILGRYEFKFDKLRIDLAFERAWREWPDRYKSQFSQVNTDLSKGTDAVWVMTHADERKQVTPLFWDWSGRSLTIYQRGNDWDSDDPRDVEYALKMIDGDVPLEGWVSLARAFLNDYDREYGKS